MKLKYSSIILAGSVALLSCACGPTPVHFDAVTLDPSQLAFQTQASGWTSEPVSDVTPTPTIDPGLPIPAVSFTDWTFFAGSPNDISHIAIEPAGKYVWAATRAGAVQWDTLTNMYFLHNRSNGLPDNEVNDIGITPDGKVWAGTGFGGLAMFDGTRWRWFTTQQGLPADGISDINVSTDGTLWIGYSNGCVSRFDGHLWTHWTQTDGLGPDAVTYLDLSESGRVVAYTKGQKYVYDGAAWNMSDFMPNGYTIVDTLMTEDGVQWFAATAAAKGDGGLIQLSGEKLVLHNNGSRIRGKFAYALAVDQNKDLWIGTDKGLVRYNGKSWTTYTPANTYGLPSLVIHDILIGLDGRFWVATNLGLAKMGRSAKWWTVFGAAEEQEDRFSLQINALAFDANNVLWISYPDGIHRLEGTNALFYNQSVIKFDQDLTAILPAPGGDVWFLGDSQIVRFAAGKWKVMKSKVGFPFTNVEAYAMDAQGRLWIGEKQTLAYYENNKWTKVAMSASLPILPERLSSMTIAADGTVWVGSLQGLYQYREGVWTSVDIFASTPVRALTLTAGGTIWAVAGEKAVMNEGGDWMMYEGDGNFTEPIERIAVSRDEKIYFVMKNQFVIFDGREAKLVGRGDGFPTCGINGVAFGSDNFVWFGTDFGMAVYHPA
jgi:ligand-binding sensor domain-containing protein